MSKENLQDIGMGIFLAVTCYAMLVMLMLF